MPFVKIKVSCCVSEDQEHELKKQIGDAIALVPGKNEESLLLEFEDTCHLWLRGQNDPPIAYIEAAVFSNEDHFGYDRFTKALSGALTAVLGIRPDRIFVKYEDITAWGVNGQYIDRRMFG